MSNLPDDINELAAHIHFRNRRWWYDEDGKKLERNNGQVLMLVISELAEAQEAIRKDLMDDKLPHRTGEEVELADAAIRLLDYAAGEDIEVDSKLIGIRCKPISENKSECLLHIAERVCQLWCNEDSEFLSEALAIIVDYAVFYELDLFGAMSEKLDYNDVRKDHTYEARKLAGGKKF